MIAPDAIPTKNPRARRGRRRMPIIFSSPAQQSGMAGRKIGARRRNVQLGVTVLVYVIRIPCRVVEAPGPVIPGFPSAIRLLIAEIMHVGPHALAPVVALRITYRLAGVEKHLRAVCEGRLLAVEIESKDLDMPAIIAGEPIVRTVAQELILLIVNN